jgi:non-ribosomal peptide synthetase component E (peptide arylation enzyme)
MGGMEERRPPADLARFMASSTEAWDTGDLDRIERRARVAPAQVALVAGERSFSYADLARRVRRLANGLRRLGVGRGDRVGWLGPRRSWRSPASGSPPTRRPRR